MLCRIGKQPVTCGSMPASRIWPYTSTARASCTRQAEGRRDQRDRRRRRKALGQQHDNCAVLCKVCPVPEVPVIALWYTHPPSLPASGWRRRGRPLFCGTHVEAQALLPHDDFDLEHVRVNVACVTLCRCAHHDMAAQPRASARARPVAPRRRRAGSDAHSVCSATSRRWGL